ncbi:alpha-ketoglutarate-dependent dioxygenase AlkB [Arcticibacterium luteifluviistationis]|uniref:Alpha-ketoglutarate-dependent dioxygenase AlkB n=2 Tax=Arcticibacterium luteifluviistationis TaxID=1784714 RepID=A0A2Z4GIC9_9BACT|nr:alpha-ketoglutarate-dependent dioxygenase AlkB [Arcticibacterium luteifluviistationis]
MKIPDASINLLPQEGIVNYHGKVFPEERNEELLKYLLEEIPWKNDEAIIFGKHIITKRKVAWYADGDYPYHYSNTTKVPLAWTPELLTLKKLVEAKCGVEFNSCLLNLYHDGDEGMGWHRDDEKTLVKDSPIASMSFGAERKFVLKHIKSKEKVELLLENGSLLVMAGTTQTYWQHALPKTKKVKTPRVNLTFRCMETV